MTAPATTTLRTEIQGLRALAVGLVFLFHTWPALVPGGFVGVDVFFVVSGYLVVGLLLRELQRDGRVDFPRFYARRIRRLLPAATTVLCAVGVGTALWLPATRWREVARDIVASVFYVQNWHLAGRSVDYHSLDNAPSPLQHFWSLSIEEQFYLACPALLVLAFRFGRRGPLALIAGIFVASLGASLVLSTDPSGYFVSHTRVWELAIGGLLAGAPAVPWRRFWGLAGVAAVGFSAFVIGPDDAFPGWVALLPTLGCAAVLASHGEGWVGRLLGGPVLCWIGDRSYSIYLWHWPVVVLWVARGGELGALATGVIAVASLVLSAASYRFVEQRFRHAGPGVPRAPVMTLASLAPLAIAGWVFLPSNTAITVDQHPGGAVLFGAPMPASTDPIPDPAMIREPRHRAFMLQYSGRRPQPRQVGVPGGRDVRLIGDSHAQHWEPALTQVALDRGWQLTVDAKMACGISERMIERSGKPYRECAAWTEAVFDALEADPPEVVILSHTSRQKLWDVPAEQMDALARADLQQVWARLEKLGATVVVIPDTPRWPYDPVECALRGEDCALPVTEHIEFGRDQVKAAARDQAAVKVLDLEPLVCPDGVCRPVIGNVFVFRDNGHLTPEYAASLGDEVGQRLDALLEE